MARIVIKILAVVQWLNRRIIEAKVRQNALATPLVRDVPLEVTLDDLRMGEWDAEEVRKLFTFLEFRTLWDRLVEAIRYQKVALKANPRNPAYRQYLQGHLSDLAQTNLALRNPADAAGAT